MRGEVNTNDILQHAFASKKKVFVPKITGKDSIDMFMLQVTGKQ